jgi:hypothetical protein
LKDPLIRAYMEALLKAQQELLALWKQLPLLGHPSGSSADYSYKTRILEGHCTIMQEAEVS